MHAGTAGYDPIYDQISERENKTFLYDPKGIVIIHNTEIYLNDFEDPLDVNQYYQAYIEKFIHLYRQYEDTITVDDLTLAGFIPEVKDYGFENIYTDIRQNKKALSRYYMNKRIILELEIERYMNGKTPIEEVGRKYSDYEYAKKLLQKYIDEITPGDI